MAERQMRMAKLMKFKVFALGGVVGLISLISLAAPTTAQTQNTTRAQEVQPQRAQLRQADPNIRPIDWEAANRDRALQQRQLLSSTANQGQFGPVPVPQNTSREALNESRLPVLLPRIANAFTAEPGRETAQPGMLLFPTPYHYTASFHLEGAMVEITGTRRILTRLPGDTRARRLAVQLESAQGLITQTESGIEMSFQRYGAAYSIAVTCDQPRLDPRCQEEDFIRSLRQSLVIVAGEAEASP